MADTATDLPTTLGALLARTVEARGDRPAFIDDKHTLTWRQTARLVEGYAMHLRDRGIGRGDPVALWLPNSADYMALIFAVARLGAVAVHVNARFRAHEVDSLLRRSTPRLLVTDFSASAGFAEMLQEVPAASRASLERILVSGTGAPIRTLDRIPVEPLLASPMAPRLAAVGATGSVPDVARPDDPAAIFTTSGSTGVFKLVSHSQRGLALHHAVVARRLGVDQSGSRILATSPFCGVAGHTRLLLAAAEGAAIVLPNSADIAALIRRHRITHAGGYTDVLARIVEAARGQPYETLRVFTIGNSPFVDNEAVFAAAARIGLPARQMYGSTEADTAFAIPPDDWDMAPGGIPIHPDSRFVIRDPDTGLDLPEGEPGALLIAGPSLFLRYHDDPDATAAAWTADGLFRTGDRAYRRGDALGLLGRYDETIRLGGFLVDPAEIETFLRLLPGVSNARVVGTNAVNGARAVAFVIARPGHALNEVDLLEACRERIASFKVPARIRVLDDFPYSDGPNGRKIRLGTLREMAISLV